MLIDDNPGSLEYFEEALRQDGVEVFSTTDPEEGLDLVREKHPHVVVTDLMMPKLSGMEIIEQIVEFDPAIDVVLITAHYSTDSAVEAITKGACDYLTKPVPMKVLRERVGRLLEAARQRLNANRLQSELSESASFEGMIGASPRMWDVYARVQRIAPHYRVALVTGATGSGKELVARALHRLSPVANGQYVVVNCSAIVETLFESELFGHVKGSFTGATHDKVGLFELAHNGTLFLDEIGDMPVNTQAKLLRALQNQEILRVGSLVPRQVNVHVVAATHRDLRQEVAAARFREDLFYRLSMVEIHVPALREREGDLVLLEQHFVRKFAGQFNKPVRGLTRRAQLMLSRHPWPGNVRELENVIGHGVMMTLSDTVDIQDLPAYLRDPRDPAQTPAPQASAVPSAAEGLEEQERRLIADALERTGGNQVHAARLLRISRDVLRYRMKKHGLA